MGKCPNCGHQALFKKKLDCKVCNKIICDKCSIYLFKIWSLQGIILDEWYACSMQCMHDFASQVENYIVATADNKTDASKIIPELVKRTILYTGMKRKLSPEANRYSPNFIVNFAPLSELNCYPKGNVLWKRLQSFSEERFELIKMENWIKAGRFEDVAKLLEKQGKYEEAGKMRARGRAISVKHTSVSVDLNSLLKQIAEQGIVAVYRCPHCGGKLKIGKETSETNLRICEHCGSEIETMDLADFLKTALS
jgi:DNA-directed RNA polymerase subunit RPC12/RpoP